MRVISHVFSRAAFGFIALCAPLIAPAAARCQTAPAPIADVHAPASATAAIEDYRLGAGDEVRITVYGEKDLTGEFYVSGSGKISFPLVGDVEADGRTIKEIDAELSTRLKDGYLVDPKLSGEVLIFRPFYILGEVNKPGQYPYTNGLTAIKAIATAQGYTYRANTKRVLIRHSGDSAEREYSLTDVVYLQPGDTVRVIERFF